MIHEEFIKRDAFLFPFIKRMFKEPPLILTNAKGALLRDINGKEYIDLFGMHSAANIGHCHPKIVEVIKNQVEKLIHVTYDFYNEPTLVLAEKLKEITPENITKFYFVNSGAEAVECAIYTARRATERYEIIALYGAFHGRTYGARTLIGWAKYKIGGGPFLPGVHHMPWYYCYRCTLNLEYPHCNIQCARMLRDVLSYQTSGEVAAFIAEPVLGTAGNIPAPRDYFKIIKKILDEFEILLIDDEVITGLGRTGKMFAIEHYDIKPDIMVFAKALGGGLPIYSVGAKEDVTKKLKPMDYFTTFGGNPLACKVALATIEVIQNERLIERSKKLGDYFLRRLKELQEKYDIIGDVRGIGLLIGVELVKNKNTKEPAIKESIIIREEARKRGLLLPAGLGWLGNVIRISPPLTITEEQINKAIEIIDNCLKNLNN